MKDENSIDMKKIIYAASAFVLLASYSCNKSAEGNKNVMVEETSDIQVENKNGTVDTTVSIQKTESDGGKIHTEYTDRYVAEDGSSALVTFKNNGKENSISIRSNNKTISAPRKADQGEGVYGNYDFQIVAKNDSVIITQGNNVIALKKARVN